MRPLNYILILFTVAFFSAGTIYGTVQIQEENRVKLALNTSTISGYGLSLPEMISLTATAGFDGIELWVQDIEAYVKAGGTLEQLSSLIRNSGLSVENMIGFAPCLSEDETTRKKGVEQFRRELEMAKRLQSNHIAVTGAGLEEPFHWERLDLYAGQLNEILEICENTGVQPLLELWGSHHLSKVEYVTAILMRTGRTDGALLLDLYHLYRGGNSWESLSVIDPAILPVIHINDYPGHLPFEQLTDADRVMTGEGICPTKSIFDLLEKKEYRGVFSVELFNESYWSLYTAEELLEKIMQSLKRIL
ncbi:MAG: sugar phosphate isomerase/epimerase [Tannerellaceae bacterium]|nr:sugar phosphate isomerase/epimerase [Tannerellaceae bacterium]